MLTTATGTAQHTVSRFHAFDDAFTLICLIDGSNPHLIARGHDPATVERVARLVDGAEYKRRQSPIGVRVSAKAFGKDRRLPITNGYR